MNEKINGEFRPCIIKTNGKHAIFHRWFIVRETLVRGLVEFEDGNVTLVDSCDIKFLDTNLFWRHCMGINELEASTRDLAQQQNGYEFMKRYVNEGKKVVVQIL